MDPNVELNREQRLKFMNVLYDTTLGHVRKLVKYADIGREAKLSKEEYERVVLYLAAKGLISHHPSDVCIAITVDGVSEVETERGKPPEATAYFPPFYNVVTIHSMTNSTIQQGGSNASQNTGLASRDAPGPDNARLEELLNELTRQLTSLKKSHRAEAGDVADVERKEV